MLRVLPAHVDDRQIIIFVLMLLDGVEQLLSIERSSVDIEAIGIGSQTAHYGRALGMTVLAADPQLTPQQAAERGADSLVDLNTLLEQYWPGRIGG